MSVDTSAEHYRGVHCRRCGKPVKVPALVAKKESASIQEHDENDAEYHLISKVFVLRCHACRKESIYSINQIVDVALVAQSVREMVREATN
jgi:cytochrome c-type biogenesis protein CcmH/NrfF